MSTSRPRAFGRCFRSIASPGWSELRRLPLDGQRHRLLDPEIRAGLVEEAAQLSARGDGPAMVANKRPLDYGEIIVFDTALPPYRSVEDVARERGTGGVETMIDLALESDFDQLFGRKLLNFDLDSLGEVLRHPRAGDRRVRHRRARQAGGGLVVPDPLPGRLGSHEAGLRVGGGHSHAHLGAGPPVRLHRPRPHPRGSGRRPPWSSTPRPSARGCPPSKTTSRPVALRLQQKATGMAATVVNGQIHLRDGEPTGAVAGRLLRGPAAHSAVHPT